MEDIKNILNIQSNELYDKILFLYNNKISNIEQEYNNKLEQIKNKYEKDLKKIENDASTFKNFGLIRTLTNENNELNRKVSSLLKEVEIYKIKYNLFYEKEKLIQTEKENSIQNENEMSIQTENEKEIINETSIQTEKEITNETSIQNEKEIINEKFIDNKKEMSIQIDNEKEIINETEIINEIENLNEMKKIKIKGNTFYLSNKIINNTQKFYNIDNIEVGYKTSSGKFYFNKI